MLKVAKLLCRPVAPAADVRKAIDGIDNAALEKAAEDLEADRQRLLARDAPDAEVDAIEERIKSAYRAAERGHAARKELEARLAEAEDREHAAGIAAGRKHAEDLTAAAIAALKELPEAYGTIRQTLRKVAAAEAACQLFNAEARPEDRVQSPEEWRNVTAIVPEVELKRSTVVLWAGRGSPDRPVSEADQRRVVPAGDGTGYIPPTGTPAPGGYALQAFQVVSRPFTRIERLPAVRYDWLSPLADALRLPAIRAGDLAGWLKDGRDTTLETLDRLEAARPAKARDDRKPEVVFLPVVDDAQARAA